MGFFDTLTSAADDFWSSQDKALDTTARIERAKAMREKARIAGLDTQPAIDLNADEAPEVTRKLAPVRAQQDAAFDFEQQVMESRPAQVYAGTSEEHAAVYEREGRLMETVRKKLTVEDRRAILNNPPGAEYAQPKSMGERIAQATKDIAVDPETGEPPSLIRAPTFYEPVVQGSIFGAEQTVALETIFSKTVNDALGRSTSDHDNQIISDYQVRASERAKLEESQSTVDYIGFSTGEILGQMFFVARDSLIGAAAGGAKGGLIGLGVGSATGGVGAGPGALVGAGLGARWGARAGAFQRVFRMEAGAIISDLDTALTVDGRNPFTAQEKLGAGVIGGSLNAMVELVGIKLGLKATGVEALYRRRITREIVKQATKPGGREFLRELGKRFMLAEASEVSTEMLQEFISALTVDIAKQSVDSGFAPLKPDELWDQLWAVGKKTLAGMAPIALVGSTAGTTSHAVQQTRQADLALDRQQFFTELNDTVSALNVRKDAPDMLAQWVQAVKADDPTAAKDVYMDREALRAAAEGAGLNWNDLVAQLPSLADPAGEAANADVVMPMEEFVSQIAGTPLYDVVAPHVRATATGMSIAEQQQLDKGTIDSVRAAMDALADEETQRLALEAAEQAQVEAEIETDVASALEAAGVAQGSDAQVMGTMVAAMVKAAGTGGGVDQRQLWKDLNLQIERGADGGPPVTPTPDTAPAAPDTAPAAPADTAPAVPDTAPAVPAEPDLAPVRPDTPSVASDLAPTPSEPLAAPETGAEPQAVPEAPSAPQLTPEQWSAATSARPTQARTLPMLMMMPAPTVGLEPITTLELTLADGLELVDPDTAPVPAQLEVRPLEPISVGVPTTLSPRTEADEVARADGRQLEQQAHHGTWALFDPVDGAPFGKFSLQFMGRGEGAQAFGWGMYFAESKALGKRYQRQVSSGVQAVMLADGRELTIESILAAQAFAFESPEAWSTWDRQFLDSSEIGELFATDLAATARANPKAPISQLIEDALTAFRDMYMDQWESPLTAPVVVEDTVTGKFYIRTDGSSTQTGFHVNGGIEVIGIIGEPGGYDTAADAIADHDMLNAEQQTRFDNTADAIRAAFAEHDDITGLAEPGHLYTVELDDNAVGLMLHLDRTVDEQAPQIHDALWNSVLPFIREQHAKAWGDASQVLDERKFAQLKGSRVYEHLARAFKILNAQLSNSEADQMASKFLKAHGIPGSRFADRASRAPGSKSNTENFVVWDEDIIEITHRDDVPVPQMRRLMQSAKPKRNALLTQELHSYVEAHPQTKGGKYLGAPNIINDAKNRKAAVRQMYATFLTLVNEGIGGRYWYEQSARKALQIAGGDPVEAERIIQLLAIYSPQAPILMNTSDALKAYNMWKQGVPEADYHVRPFGQEGRDNLDDKAIAVLYRGEAWNGRKTNSFYLNLMSEFIHGGLLTPAQLLSLNLPPDVVSEVDRAVTVDLWMRRVAGFETDATSDDGTGKKKGTGTVLKQGRGQYSFTENVTRNLAEYLTRKTGTKWTPHQVQAAVWVGAKMRWEDPEVKAITNRRSADAGYSSFNGTKWVAPATAAMRRPHLMLWRDVALSEDFSPERLESRALESRFDFGMAMDALTRVITFETRPSDKLDPVLAAAPFEVQQHYSQLQAQLITDEAGKDLLAEQIGIALHRRQYGAGGYMGEIAAGTQTSLSYNKVSGTYDDAAAIAYARAVQYLYGQDAVPYMRFDPSATRDPRPYNVVNADGKTVRKFATQEEADASAAPAPTQYLVKSDKGRTLRRFDSQADADAYAKPEKGHTVEVEEHQAQFTVVADARATFKGEETPRPASHGVVLQFPRRLNKDRLQVVADALVKHIGEDAGFTQTSPDTIAVFNFVDDENGFPFAMTDEAFDAAVDAMLADLPQGTDAGYVMAQTNYGPIHDWAEDPDGKALKDWLTSNLAPDVVAWISDRREESEGLRKSVGRQLEADPSGESVVQSDLQALTQDLREGGYAAHGARRLYQSAAGPDGRAELSDQQVRNIINEYGDKGWGDGKVRGHVIRMRIDDFLALTTNDDAHMSGLEDGSDPFKYGLSRGERNASFDPVEFETNDLTGPRLGIDAAGGTGIVTGHEGRHRAAAAQRAGASTIPVVLYTSQRTAKLDFHTFRGAFRPVRIPLRSTPVPATPDSFEALRAVVGDGSAPDAVLERRRIAAEDKLDKLASDASAQVSRAPAMGLYGKPVDRMVKGLHEAYRGQGWWESTYSADEMLGDLETFYARHAEFVGSQWYEPAAKWADDLYNVPVYNKPQWLLKQLIRSFAYGDAKKTLLAAQSLQKYSDKPGQWDADVQVMDFDPNGNPVEYDPNDVRRLNQPTPGAPRAQVDLPVKLGQRATVIRMFSTADRSSFFHEMGHTFLLMIEYAATRTSATAEMKRDWQTIRQWLGVGEDGVVTDEMHEKWARGFEAYIFEGNKPSDQMAMAYETFSRWLTNVYRSITELDVELSDEVREVMSRLLAAEQATEQARMNLNVRPAFTDAASSGMTASQWERYQKLVMTQGQDAEAAFRMRVMEDLAVKQKASYKARKKQLTEETFGRLSQLPVHRLVAHINGKGPPTPDEFPKLRMDMQLVKERYGKEMVDRLRAAGRRGLFSPNAGMVDPATYAYLFGYSDEAALLEDLATTPSLDEHVRLSVAEQLDDQYGNLLDPIDPYGDAVEAQMNAQLGDMLNAEFYAIAKSGAHAAVGRAVSDAVLKADNVATVKEDREQLAIAQQLLAEAEQLGNATLIRAARERLTVAQAVVKAGVARRKASLAALQRTRAVQRSARVQRAIVRAAAEEAVGNMSVTQVQNPTHLMASIRRAQDAAEKALASGDTAAALEAKHRAVLQAELYRAMVEARDQVATMRRRWSKYKIPAGKWNADFVDAMKTVLEKFSFKNSTAKDRASWRNMQTWATEREAEGWPVHIPDLVQSQIQVRPYDTLTVADARELHDTLRQIVAMANLDKKIATAKQQLEYDAVVAELKGKVREVHGISADAELDLTTSLIPNSAMASIKRMASRWDAAHLQPEFIFDGLDGAQPDGPWHRYLFRPIQDAVDREALMLDAAARAFKKLVDLYGRADKKSLQDVYKITEPGVATTTITREQVLSIAANQGNTHNKTAVVEGYADKGWTQDFVDLVLERYMSKKDWDFVQGMWDWIDTYWEDSRELQRRMTGLTPVKVDAEVVHTRFGDYRGGYYPLKFDPSRSSRVEHREAKSNVMDMFGGNWARAQTKQGHLEERRGSGGLPVLLALNVAQSHVHNVIHDITHREAIWSVNKLLKNEELRAYITQVIGEDGYKQLPNWLASVAAGRSIDAIMDDPNAFVGALRRNFTVVAMGMKLTTALLQPLGFSQTIAFFDQTFQKRRGKSGTFIALDGLSYFYNPMTGSPKRKVDFVHQRSAYMRNRATSMDRDLHAYMNELKNEGNTDSWRARFFMHIQLMDSAVTYPSWYAAYRAGMEDFTDANGVPQEDRAIAFADRTVRMSQGSGLLANLPRIMRGGPTSIAFTMFMTYFSAYDNMNRRGAMLWRKSGGIKSMSANMHLGYQFLMLTVLPVVVGDLMLGRGPDDDDDDPWYEHWGWKVGLYPLMGRTWLRDIASAVENDYGYTLSPLQQTGETIAREAKRALRGDDLLEDMTSATSVKGSLFVVGLFTGLFPSAQMWLTGNYLWKWNNGEVDSFSLYEALVTGKDTPPLSEQVKEAIR